eukprot:9468288-Pyramimonas_sp.AAC.1
MAYHWGESPVLQENRTVCVWRREIGHAQMGIGGGGTASEKHRYSLDGAGLVYRCKASAF